jgi:aryl-alcohol dehydrogenase-like predicted oxidoreductase
VTPAQVAINYLLRKPAVSSVLIGARNYDQLKDNIGAATWCLSAEEVNRLEAVSPAKTLYPTWVQQNIFGARNPRS